MIGASCGWITRSRASRTQQSWPCSQVLCQNSRDQKVQLTCQGRTQTPIASETQGTPLPAEQRRQLQPSQGAPRAHQSRRRRSTRQPARVSPQCGRRCRGFPIGVSGTQQLYRAAQAHNVAEECKECRAAVRKAGPAAVGSQHRRPFSRCSAYIGHLAFLASCGSSQP